MSCNIPPILQVGHVLLSADILTEYFCCDLDKCHGLCCVEGDAGAPVTLEEIDSMEACLDKVWPHLSASAQAVVDKQGVAYPDADGDMVTSIVVSDFISDIRQESSKRIKNNDWTHVSNVWVIVYGRPAYVH